MEETNVLAVKEEKGTIKKIWEKIVNANVKRQQMHLKSAPITLAVVSVFVPEVAPVLTKISEFLKTDTGKRLIEITNKGYESVGEVLKGNMESVEEEYKKGLNLFSENEAGKMALDVRNLIGEIKGMSK